MHKIQILTVSQLNMYLKSILESDNNLSNVFLRGEISNFKNHFSSGHLYFSIKDESSVIKCIMFARLTQNLRFSPDNGINVLIRGRVSIYESSGQYQIYVEDMQPEGIGELFFAFEHLKQKLSKEGLFNQVYKKVIPEYPENIGIITSKSGAVLQDIKNIIFRRYPLCNIILKSVSVQGEGSAAQIISAIERFNETRSADVLIICRGGGSLEDLWEFNNENLARAIFKSDIPIISAVGHETDFTICDFVSDMRAPTPSAAAELAVPNTEDLIEYVNGISHSLECLLKHSLSLHYDHLLRLELSLKHFSPANQVNQQILNLEKTEGKLLSLIHSIIEKKESYIYNLISTLDALNPTSILNRGYSITYKDNIPVSLIDNISINDLIKVRLLNGIINCKVKNVKKQKYNV